MSITITIQIPDLQMPGRSGQAGDIGRVGRELLPLLGPVLLPMAEGLIPGLGIAVALVGAVHPRVSL